MTQDESWKKHYDEVMRFMQHHKRRPSKYYPDERLMHNWIRHNQKQLGKGLLPEYRINMFNQLLELMRSYRRRNQYV